MPSSSWDLATSATVYQISLICPGTFYEDVSHTEFTLAFATREGLKLEITPFLDRHDYRWIRGPVQSPEQPVGTLAQDLSGRDFTINAMAYDPIGRLLFDSCDGRGDLRRRLVRSLPDAEARFRLDPVRILRGIRIAGKLGFEIEPGTLAAMGHSLEGAGHNPRRLLMELVRLLCGPRPSGSLDRLREMGQLSWVCPALAEVGEEKDPWASERTIIDRLAQVLERLSPPAPEEALCALAAACMVRDVPPTPWNTLSERQLHGLRSAFSVQLRRLLEPMESPDSSDDSIWWIATFGIPEGNLRIRIESLQGWESAWAPSEIVGWPRLADAWWTARANEDGHTAK